ncbi:6-carboxytetrahydropterin synthase [Candidatus Sumerlaeota bacterium]|nr:6-carboxytetrahydropterin synthase [Candidatus Sumerlaeales bacterium]NLD60906.1 6-carboxytetrahydropterin synthase [Candidatus Sumerlaeota bacterium]
MHTVQVTAHFSSAHRLARPDWSDEHNAQVYGVCSNKNGHGHNYKLIVEVEGAPDPETAMVTNYVEVAAIVQSEIIDKVDHMNLDIDVPFLHGKVTTTETLLTEFWAILNPLLRTNNAHLSRLTIVEGNGCATSYSHTEKDMSR